MKGAVYCASSQRGPVAVIRVFSRGNRRCAAFAVPLAMAGLLAVLQGAAAQAPAAGAPVLEPELGEGIVHLDVAISTPDGHPVVGIQPSQVTVLDNGKPVKVRAFHAYDVRIAPPAPTQLFLVLDAINLDSDQYRMAQGALQHFLVAHNGRLDQPTSILRLDWSGVTVSHAPSRNGRDLLPDVTGSKGARRVLHGNPFLHPSLMSCEGQEAANALSLTALGAMVLDLRRQPGRKIVVWIGPGWPVGEAGPCVGTVFNHQFDEITELSTRMREARMALSAVSVWPSTWDYHAFLAAPSSAGSSKPEHLALDVLASQSGGQVLVSPYGLDELMRKAARDTDVLYTVSFDPPPTDRVDDYHSIAASVPGTELVARTSMGYYNEPSYIDHPATPPQRLSLREIEDELDGRHHGMEKVVSGIVPTERIPAEARKNLENHVHGAARKQLVGLIDAAEFEPPADLPQRPAPSIDEQRRIFEGTLHYLKNVIPMLPDFEATRTTTFYGERVKQETSWKSGPGEEVLEELGTTRERLRNRDGREEVEGEKAGLPPLGQERRPGMPSIHGGGAMQIQGTFGPILSTIAGDAVASLAWSRWEQGPQGMLAVFRFAVPQNKSHYSIGFCCATDMQNGAYLTWRTAYHGEITVDTQSGAVMRLMIEADPDASAPTGRADIVVIYAPVDIGGVSYICPVRSIAISRKHTVFAEREWGGTLTTYGPFATMLNDVTYSQYRKFGTTMRILPGFEPVQ